MNTSETSGLGNCFGGASISLDNNEEMAHPIFRQIDEDNIATVTQKKLCHLHPKRCQVINFIYYIYSSS